LAVRVGSGEVVAGDAGLDAPRDVIRGDQAMSRDFAES
jgi:hypothetical protein